MAKKAANTNHIAMDKSSSASAAASKKSPARDKKHLKAQAAGVAAAVEVFVHSIVAPAGESPAKAEEVNETVAEKVEAPIAETPVHQPHESPAKPRMASEEEIAVLAFENYLKRGGQNGSQADDWFRAEQTLRAGK